MLPAIAAGAGWLADLILPLLAWEGASRGASILGRRLLGSSAAELAEAAAAKAGTSMLGKNVTSALNPAAKILPASIGEQLTAGGLASTGVRSGAALGGLIAGSMGATAMSELLSRPSPQAQQEAAGMQAVVQKAQMQDALSRYLGNPDLARQLLSGGGV